MERGGLMPAVAFLYAFDRQARLRQDCGLRARTAWSLLMQPVQRISKSRKRKRRSHMALRPVHYVRCPQCGTSKMPHCACGNCGYVNPKLALQVEEEAK